MKRIILSGGGTGGHIYPAVAVAEALQRRYGNDVELLFVGAEGKMEMEKIPALGYRIVGLPILGIQRRFTLKNLTVPFRLAKSLMKAREIIKLVKPDRAIYEALCTRFGIVPENAVFLDDRPENTEAARAFGMQAITVESKAQADAALRALGVNWAE